MSMIYSSTQMRRTATSLQQVVSPFLRFRSAWQKHRERRRVQAALTVLSDRELMDIGVARGEIDYVAAQRGVAGLRRSTRGHIGDALVIWLLGEGDRR